MKEIYSDSSIPEKLAKAQFHIFENIMMENAAAALEKEVLAAVENTERPSVLILCGKGNNGGDGLALSRRLYGSIDCNVILTEQPSAKDAVNQLTMAQALGVNIHMLKENGGLMHKAIIMAATVIVDCIYGTGFKGELPEKVKQLIEAVNTTNAYRIACDVPTGLDKNGNISESNFMADSTVTMGALKLPLFSDGAKTCCGKITVANLGISSASFASCHKPDCYLVEKSDLELPFRTQENAHKGSFGHTAVFAGEKSGAAIMCASAANSFGSGLTTLIKMPSNTLDQFKISPQLMLSKTIPDNASCICMGCGLGKRNTKRAVELLEAWFNKTEAPACVLDADFFNYDDIFEFLTMLNSIQNAKIILTPHLAEFSRLLKKIKSMLPEIDISTKDTRIKELANNPLRRTKAAKVLTEIFPNITFVVKSANTFIAVNDEIFIVADGAQSLAKGGSGDILAGMIGSLLAQGYSAKAAAITACEAHALAAKNYGEQSFDLTAEKLIEEITLPNV